MKKISYWAKNHVLETRLLIIAFWTATVYLGIFAGRSFTEAGLNIPVLYFYIAVAGSLMVMMLYPHKFSALTLFFRSYRRRKLLDFAIAICTFMMIIYTGNHWNDPGMSIHSARAIPAHGPSKDSSLRTDPLITSFLNIIKQKDIASLTVREKIKIIKAQLKAVKKAKDRTEGQKVVLITLSVLLGIVLLAGVAALSCSIGCSGSGALAVIVALGGTFLVVWLVVGLIRNITGKKKRAKGTET